MIHIILDVTVIIMLIAVFTAFAVLVAGSKKGDKQIINNLREENEELKGIRDYFVAEAEELRLKVM